VKDVSVDQQAVFELVRKYNSRSTPTIVVDGKVMIGFDPDRLDKMLAD
jgi:glutaredoxin